MASFGPGGCCSAGRVLAGLATLFGLLLWAGVAQASFPGHNGRIVYARGQPLFTSNLDGSDEQQITSGVGVNEPAWSPDGSRIAVTINDANVGNEEVHVMNADGTGSQDITNDPANDYDPAWSPAGNRLVFSSGRGGSGRLWLVNADGTGTTLLGNGEEAQWSPDGTRIAVRATGGIATMKPDGSGQTTLTSGFDREPNWSPDGTKIVFSRYVLRQPCTRFCDPYTSYELWTVNADGTDERRITSPPGGSGDSFPVWSPDGTRILFTHWDSTSGSGGLYVLNPDGTDVQPVVPGFQGYGVDWQPLPVNTPSTHVRPKGATPLRVSLVPAFAPCLSPDRTHGPPLAFGSCAAPRTSSSILTVGASDAGQGQSKSVGSARLDPQVGLPGPPDDTDVQIRLSITNVMRASDLTDYTGELEARPVLRITDKDGTVSSTWRDLALSFPVPCTATADPALGGMCTASTSADAVMPGLAPEGSRAVWELQRFEVRDGGADGDAETAGNLPFVTQGVFVP